MFYQSSELMDRHFAAALQLSGAEKALVVATCGGVTRSLEPGGFTRRALTHPWDWSVSPYQPGQTITLSGAKAVGYLDAVSPLFRISSLGQFLRFPILVKDNLVCALMLASEDERPIPTKRTLKLLRGIADSIGEIAEQFLTAPFRKIALLQ